MNRVLAVDDDMDIRNLVEDALAGEGYEFVFAENCGQTMEIVEAGFSGVIVLDVRLPDGVGFELLPRIAEVSPDSPVIFLTGHGSTMMALESIQAGAFDFIEKIELVQRLKPAVQAAFAHRASRIPDGRTFENIITQSAAMADLFRSLRRAVVSDVSVLIRGESGTGKELVANALHDSGARSNAPFVAVNCAGIPDHLLEAELFGYERGAFTGAVGRKPGRFDLANGGSLLLDEIGEMPMTLQAKLLRVLQEGEYQRLGGVETLHTDVRIISATNRDLEACVEQGSFREDLYYRLAVFTVELPPLRLRLGDVPLLVEHFIRRAAEKESKNISGVDSMALALMEHYPFPGNVRQLENVITHAVVTSGSSVIRMSDLPPSFLRSVMAERSREPVVPIGNGLAAETGTFLSLKEMEEGHIRKAMVRADGNKSRAAKLLGISRMTLYRKLEDLDPS
jgi:two-component system, NtrC family, response regulator AtoC